MRPVQQYSAGSIVSDSGSPTARCGGCLGPCGQIRATWRPAQSGRAATSESSGARGSSTASSRLICAPVRVWDREAPPDDAAANETLCAPAFCAAAPSAPDAASSVRAPGRGGAAASSSLWRRSSEAISRRRAKSSNSSARARHSGTFSGRTAMSSRVRLSQALSDKVVSSRQMNISSRWPRILSWILGGSRTK